MANPILDSGRWIQGRLRSLHLIYHLFSKYLPDDNSQAYRYIQGMLGTGLGDFQGKISFRDHLFTYAVDLIAKNKAILCRGLWTKFLKRQTFSCLLDDDDLIALSL